LLLLLLLLMVLLHQLGDLLLMVCHLLRRALVMVK
jgi:hypothetical protein